MADGQVEQLEGAGGTGKGSAGWSGAHVEGYSGSAGRFSTLADTADRHSPLPTLGIDNLTEAHENTHATTAGPDLGELKDPKNGLDAIKKLDNWVAEKEKNSCIDSKQLADSLMNYAHESVKGWTDKNGSINPPENAPEIYEHFDKLLDKLDELKSKDKDWNDENSPNSKEAFHKKLPWHFMPGE